MKRALASATLDTPRMSGEPIGPEHESELAELILDPRVYRTLWPWATSPTRADARASLVDKRDHWERHGFGLWLLRDRATGLMVGRGGLQYTDAIGGFAVEAAWTIVPERWGEGLATELAGRLGVGRLRCARPPRDHRHHAAGQRGLPASDGEGRLWL